MKRWVLLVLFSVAHADIKSFDQVIAVIDKVSYITQKNEILDVDATPPVVLNMRDFEGTGKSIAARFTAPHGAFKAMRLFTKELYIQEGNTTRVPLRLQAPYIAIEGNFTISPRVFTTQELDFNLSRDITQDAALTYSYTPDIRVKASHELKEIFYKIDHRRGKESLTMRILPEGKIEAIVQEHPEVLISGDYDYDKQAKTITLTPTKLSCPDCNIFKKALMKVIPKPNPYVYDVLDVTPNEILIFELKKYFVSFHKTQEFKIFYRP